jgi:translation initiation factor 6
LLVRLDFVGNPYIGVYCAASDSLMVASSAIPKKTMQKIGRALDVPTIQTTIGGSTVVGSLVRMNSHGIVVNDFVADEEKRLFKGVNMLVSPHKLNAMGNNVLCNDNGAVVHPGYDRQFVSELEDALDVEVVRGTVAGIRTVGSWAVATNRGALCHPHVRDEEKSVLEEVLKVPATITTANYGTAQIGACMVANGRGAAVGNRTTPIEMGRIEDGLML